MVSEQAPERPAGDTAPGGPKRDNVFTRKIGPLPMWVWLAIAAALIVGYMLLVKGKGKKSGQQGPGRNPQQGYGRALLPDIVINRFINRPPHQGHKRRHHHRGGNGDGDHDPDPHGQDEATALEAARQAAIRDPGPGVHHIPGHNRRHMRGEPIPGELVQFKTADRGQTPSLQDVANHYGTEPDAIVMEAEGRGYPTSTAWKRYVSRHDWASPLPPATDLSILAHPTG